MRFLPLAALYFFLLFGISLGVSAQGEAVVSPDAATKTQPEPTALTPEDEEWIRKTPLKTKVGQLFIFGFMGSDLSRGLKQIIVNQRPGAIIVFGRNIKTARQLIDLNRSAQKQALDVSGLPLLVAVDQEGGSVIRIKTSPPLPSALALGESGDPELVYSAGLHTGHLLKALGFNMNLAPVLDVADPSKDLFVGTRTFGKDPEIVGKMGTHFALGLKEAGILPTVKHFPGHGGVSDSHRETPIKDTPADVLAKVDLVPFSDGLRDVPDSAVMLAHIAYPKLDQSRMPATFSRPIITDLLRDKMKFKGLVVTDDIEMAGAFVVKNPAERAVRAIEAGADLVMVAWNKRLQASAVDAVIAAVRKGRLSEARIDESLRRIIRAKRQVGSGLSKEAPDKDDLRAVLHSEELKRLTFETLNRQFEGATKKLPKKEMMSDQTRPIFIFSATDGFYSSFRQSMKERLVRFFRLTSLRTFDINRVLRANPDAIGVLHISGQQSARFANRLDPDNAARMILINSETISLLKTPSSFLHIVDIHFRHPDLGRLTAHYMFGGTRAAELEPATRDPAETPDTRQNRKQKPAASVE